MEGLSAFTSEEEVLDGYQVLRVLGQGGFGLVKLAYHWESRSQVAVKVVENGGQHSCGFQQLCAEAEIMRGLQHPHIIKLLQVRHTAERGYIFMECAVRGDLRGYMVERGYLLDGEIRQLLTQTLLAVHYCHAQHVVHRDLKLENLLLDANLNIKLSDFGLSCKLADGERLRSLCGTFAYCAPEEFLGEEFCGYKADVWSVGVILYAMAAGALPFVGEDFVELQAAILSGYYRIPHYGNPELCNLVDSLLTRDPEARPTAADIMGHPWLQAGHEAPATRPPALPGAASPVRAQGLQRCRVRRPLCVPRASSAAVCGVPCACPGSAYSTTMYDVPCACPGPPALPCAASPVRAQGLQHTRSPLSQ
ncbi:serine/threonine-protein kinase MARK2-like [Lepus europaeus]|uniref:serine/threonine-protein kinase MARK2-like n=1 Tax=Lepus europaeus TaxID=9983 RepID=UPI002B4695D8|nr:serine/threonine-protein kinase MARK2-like [Lepus europaeus]